MASKIIGRAACPLGDNESAHVKQSDKCIYLYCPECGTQLHARTEKQRALLMAKTRLIDAPATPTVPTPTPRGDDKPAPAAPTGTGSEKPAPVPTPTPTPEPAPKPKSRGLFF